MKRRFLTTRILAIGVGLGVLVSVADGAPGSRPVPGGVSDRGSVRVAFPPDSVLEELRIGRYWHASRVLRAQGFADPAAGIDGILALAKAEAGWGNWSEVVSLLEGWDGLEERQGDGLRLLGSAYAHLERWGAAAEYLERHAARVGAGGRASVPSLVSAARARWRAGEKDRAFMDLSAVTGATTAQSWGAVEFILDAAAQGDTSAVRQFASLATDSLALVALWRAEADAFLSAGDSLSAAASLRRVVVRAGHPRRPDAQVELGRLLLATGDTSTARALLLDGVQGASSDARVRAAASLIDLGSTDIDALVGWAALAERGGDAARALRAYDHAVLRAREEGHALPDPVRLERARLASTVRARREEALAEFRAIRESGPTPAVGARNLELWARMRGRERLDAQVQTLRRWLVDEYPSSAEGVEVRWRWGTDAEGRGRVGEALGHYEAVAQEGGAQPRAGEARMRIGQIHLGAGRHEEASSVFEAYLTDFPDGRRWEEASYWAGRARLERGDTIRGFEHLRRVRRQPVSYYGVLAAELLEERYDLEVDDGPSPVAPSWMVAGLDRLDLLLEAGLEEGATAEIARLRERARGSRDATLHLAEALIDRGRTIEGINLGWALRDEGHPWDRHLLRVVFPFPHRELIRREAEEWGMDPILLAALIRQESAFKADIVSHAGAVGLMQVMPGTGAEVARRHGPDAFEARSLATPDVNLHLGSAFLEEMTRRYDGTLPLVLSAYNAGPTRATRWRSFPEVVDLPRFTERIPIEETRGYVKNIRRNLEIYRALYGEE